MFVSRCCILQRHTVRHGCSWLRPQPGRRSCCPRRRVSCPCSGFLAGTPRWFFCCRSRRLESSCPRRIRRSQCTLLPPFWWHVVGHNARRHTNSLRSRCRPNNTRSFAQPVGIAHLRTRSVRPLPCPCSPILARRPWWGARRRTLAPSTYDCCSARRLRRFAPVSACGLRSTSPSSDRRRRHRRAQRHRRRRRGAHSKIQRGRAPWAGRIGRRRRRGRCCRPWVWRGPNRPPPSRPSPRRRARSSRIVSSWLGAIAREAGGWKPSLLR